MSMQSLRDGFYVPWRKVFAWGWFGLLFALLTMLLWVVAGWKAFAAAGGLVALAVITAWAVKQIDDE